MIVRTLMRMVSGLALAGFLAGLVVLHVAEGALSPAPSVVSEYANTSSGWLMVLCFVAWAASLAAAAYVALESRSIWSSVRVRVAIASLLTVSAFGILLAAVFPTQAESGALPSGEQLDRSGALHNVGSGVATAALFVAAGVTALSRRSPTELRYLSWAVLGSAIVIQGALLVVGPSLGGIRQRALILLACFWQVALLAAERKDAGIRTAEAEWNHVRR